MFKLGGDGADRRRHHRFYIASNSAEAKQFFLDAFPDAVSISGQSTERKSKTKRDSGAEGEEDTEGMWGVSKSERRSCIEIRG